MKGSTVDGRALRLTTARAWKKANAAPGEAFGSIALFANPAWALILELYLARAEQRRLSLAEAAQAMAIAESSAMRWVKCFEQAGWVATVGLAEADQPCALMLTDAGLARTDAALDLAIGSDRSLGLQRLEFA